MHGAVVALGALLAGFLTGIGCYGIWTWLRRRAL